MLSLSSVLPVHALSPVLRPVHSAFAKVSTAARPIAGTGLAATVVMLFKPVVHSLLKVALALVSPKPAAAAGFTRRTASNIVMLNRMASELDTQQPQLAAELRLLAAQG